MRQSTRDLLNRIIPLAAVLLLGGTTHADSEALLQKLLCSGGGTPPDQQIGVCTAVIDSSSSTPPMLAEAVVDRGNTLRHRHQHDLAIEDCDRAMQIHSNMNYGNLFRGVAHLSTGDHQVAVDEDELYDAGARRYRGGSCTLSECAIDWLGERLLALEKARRQEREAADGLPPAVRSRRLADGNRGVRRQHRRLGHVALKGWAIRRGSTISRGSCTLSECR
jgi:hypothetical protein